jgi:hypothetical protein
MSRTRRHPIRHSVTLLLVTGLVAAGLITFKAPLVELAAQVPVIGAQCPSSRLHTTTITLTVAPELRESVEQTLSPLRKRAFPAHECVQFDVQTQASAETVQSAQILPPNRAPDIWIPDSSLWTTHTTLWRLNPQGSFATSPVVIATNQLISQRLGWNTSTPTWAAALSGRQPIALPDIPDNAAELSAVIALWQSLGRGAVAQKALAGTVLAAGRSGAPDATEAIAAAENGSLDAALVPTSLQAITAANAVHQGRTKLIAVRPTGGSPFLDYPVLTTGPPAKLTATTGPSAIRAQALRAVVAELLNGTSRPHLERAGFGIPDSSSPILTTFEGSVQDVAVTPITGLDPRELTSLVDRITVLSAPSRLLTIFDLSTSMKASAVNGQTRIEFAATAATLAGNLLTDSSQVGLWGFARDLQGERDILKMETVAPLGARQGSRTHREQLIGSMQGATKVLGGNGTALFATVVAGMTEMNRRYDPRSGNAVVLFTDGANFDPGGPSLKQTVAELGRLYDPKKPVRLICIGIGADADMDELEAMATAAGGQAFLAKRPEQLPDVLLEVMTRRDS